VKIIPASAEIITPSKTDSLEQHIERCGRICYKSEDQITEGSSEKFIKNVIKRGHTSVLEMGVISVVLDMRGDPGPLYPILASGYIQSDISEGGYELILTGNVRAFLEFNRGKGFLGVNALNRHLYKLAPNVFSNLAEPTAPSFPRVLGEDSLCYAESIRGVSAAEFYKGHVYALVKFTVDRATSHQLVRHRTASFLQESQRYCNYGSGKFGGEVTFVEPSGIAQSSFRDWEAAMSTAEEIYLTMLGDGAAPQVARAVLPNSCKTELLVNAPLGVWDHMFSLRCSKHADPSMREVMVPLHEKFKAQWPLVFDQTL